MKNNINLDAHSSLIIADGSIVEINGQKVLLTLVRDADAPEPKKIDLHKDSWGVLNDGSQRFKDTVVKWINIHKNHRTTGEYNNHYYGFVVDGTQLCTPSPDFTHILTIDEFCDLAKYVPCSDVTETPPLPSLKYEDCFERIRPQFWVDDYANIFECEDSTDLNNVPTERQAKQLAATIKLMTIMHDVNGGEFIPKYGETAYYPMYDSCNEKIYFDVTKGLRGNQLAFRDYETAQRAYEANKEIFHDYFGVGGENE